VALVTGAAGAIGAGVVRGLLREGCQVVATDLPGARLDALAAELAPEAARGWPRFRSTSPIRTRCRRPSRRRRWPSAAWTSWW
jgi:NAD(P)-dependent dehydrogenase (short-subunit alcohol dehydrogenase family)